jgi:hypothetical protein
MASYNLELWSYFVQTWRGTPSPVRTILIAAVGVGIGAWLTSRAQAKRRILDELKAVRAARLLSFSIANKALAMKRQHIRAMKQRYDVAVAAYNQRQAGPLQISLDLQTLSRVKFPGDVLEKIVFEKCALEQKALAAVVSLSGAIDDLTTSIDFRNGLISEFREKHATKSEREKIELYVGAPSAGLVDSRFAHNIEALSHQADDCIFFSMLLSDELTSYGNAMRSRKKLKFRLGIQKFWPADWSIARGADLIPPDSQYADWLRGFKRVPSVWHRICDRFRRESLNSSNKPAFAPNKRLQVFGKTGYRRRSSGSHSTFFDHKKK